MVALIVRLFSETPAEFSLFSLIKTDSAAPLGLHLFNIDLAKPKIGAPQLFFGVLLLIKIFQHICKVNCKRFFSFSPN